MSLWSKRILFGIIALSMMVAPFLSGCKSKEKSQADASKTAEASKQEAKPRQFHALDTKSSKVIATYSGGQLTEGERNTYINICAFLNPGLGMLFSDPARLEKFQDEIAKQVAVGKYMAEKMKKNESLYAKQADDDLKEFEKQLNQQESVPQGKGAPAPKKAASKKLEDRIKGKGFTKEQLRQFIIRNRAQEAYAKSKLDGKTYDKVKVNHILISFGEDKMAAMMPKGKEKPKKKRTEAEAKKLADDVKKKLVAGGNFAKLAKQYSDDPMSKNNSGLVEGPAQGFVPEFARASLKLPLNQISEPVKTSFGFHVMKVIARSKESLKNAPEQIQQMEQGKVIQNVANTELKFKSLLPPPKVAKPEKPAAP